MEGSEEKEKSSASSARVMIWCAPRSTSNLFAKCLTAIEGMEVWIEPYQYAYFALCEMKRMGLSNDDTESATPFVYEGNEERFEKAAEGMSAFFQSEVIPDRLPYRTVKRSLENSKSRYVLVKDMGVAMPSDSLRNFLPAGFKHTFLLRHPSLAFRSYRKAIVSQMVGNGQRAADFESTFDITTQIDGASPNAVDFYQKNYELWRYVRDNIDPNPVVIDSSDLLRDPARILSKYCEAVGLPYSDSLLTWEATPASYRSWRLAGDRILDNVDNFIGALMKTTGFLTPSEIPPRDQLSSDVIRASDAVMPYYNEMYATRIS